MVGKPQSFSPNYGIYFINASGGFTSAIATFTNSTIATISGNLPGNIGGDASHISNV
jgi:hypothetical protein